MAEVKGRVILDAIPAGDPFKALEDLNHWLESVRAWEGLQTEQGRRSCRWWTRLRRFTSQTPAGVLSSQRPSISRKTGCGR